MAARRLLIVDGHEDLALNILADGRNYLASALVTRAAEAGGPVPEVNGLCMLGLPEWLRGGVAVIVATITTIPRDAARLGELSYWNVEASYQQALAQLAIYQRYDAGLSPLTLLRDAAGLDTVLASWDDDAPDGETGRQIGLVLLMENAESIRTPEEVGWWHAEGLRLVGPAWDANRYTGASLAPGPLTDLGRALLDEMARYNIVLDLSHMADEACLEALERYPGPVVASHSNPRRLAPHQRNIPDEVIRGIVAHDGVVGIMPLIWAIHPQRDTPKVQVSLDAVVDAIDIICDLAGDALHVAIGSDFDGGQGAEAAPAELDTIADLPLLAGALARRGYAADAIAAIMHGNWLRVLRRAL